MPKSIARFIYSFVKFSEMPSVLKFLFHFLVIFTFALATSNPSRINLRFVGLFFLRDGSNLAKHFVPKLDAFRAGKYILALGIPSQGHRWSMWQAADNQTMRMFGTQIKGNWYFIQVRNTNVVLVNQTIPRNNTAFSNSNRWFAYVNPQQSKTNVLYHQRTDSYITIKKNKVASSTDLELASYIAIDYAQPSNFSGNIQN